MLPSIIYVLRCEFEDLVYTVITMQELVHRMSKRNKYKGSSQIALRLSRNKEYIISSKYVNVLAPCHVLFIFVIFVYTYVHLTIDASRQNWPTVINMLVWLELGMQRLLPTRPLH